MTTHLKVLETWAMAARLLLSNSWSKWHTTERGIFLAIKVRNKIWQKIFRYQKIPKSSIFNKETSPFPHPLTVLEVISKQHCWFNKQTNLHISCLNKTCYTSPPTDCALAMAMKSPPPSSDSSGFVALISKMVAPISKDSVPSPNTGLQASLQD